MNIMKNFLIMLVACMTLTSCYVTAQVPTTEDDMYVTTTTGVDYVYYDTYYHLGINCPVMYFNSIPYYLYRDLWFPIDFRYRGSIWHFNEGRPIHAPRFNHPRPGMRPANPVRVPDYGRHSGPTQVRPQGSPMGGQRPQMNRQSSTRRTVTTPTQSQPRINNNRGSSFTPQHNMQSQPSMGSPSRSMGSPRMGGRR